MSERERTCADCIDFAPITCDGESTGRGLCMVDAEMVRSDNPQCSNAPASHARTISDHIGGTNEQDSVNQPAKA